MSLPSPWAPEMGQRPDAGSGNLYERASLYVFQRQCPGGVPGGHGAVCPEFRPGCDGAGAPAPAGKGQERFEKSVGEI